MRKKDTAIMDKICKFIDDYYFEYHTSPSMAKISNFIGLARSSIHRYIVDMNEQGILTYDGKTLQTNTIKKSNIAMSKADILGSISCGMPLLSEENIEESVSLPSSLFGSGELYILRASGDSMIEAGISNGDFVVIRKQNTANHGDIVVALIENENTLKRFLKDDINKKIILHPENKNLKDIIVDECFIQGVAQSVIKSL